MKNIKLHIYSNDNFRFRENLGLGPMWHVMKQWRDIASDLNIDMHLGPSSRQKKIDEHRRQFTDTDKHGLPDRHRTIMEANDNGKLVYYNQQDWPGIGADLDKVPDLFSLGIKLQYREGNYDKVPFKVVPFTYISPGHPELNFLDCREMRSKILKKKAFKYSVMWCGNTGKSGLANRKAINEYLCEHSKCSIHGRYHTGKYYQYICESMAGASARGTGEFCHRDIEFMAIGTPFFRKTFKNQTYNPLIPNVHYYSIGGDEVGINKTMKHFVDFFEPNGKMREFTKEEFDQYCEIMNNAQKWFDENAHPRSSLKLLMHILEENNIL